MKKFKLLYIIKRLKGIKTNAGILVYALIITLITLLVLIGFLQFFMISNQEKLFLLNEDKKDDLLQSGIELLLSTPLNSQDTIFSVTLSDKELHEQILKSEKYGLFDLLTSSLIWGNDTIYKIALATDCKKRNNIALVTQSGQFQLKIGGDALLEGDIEIPPKGIERAYLSGKNYSRDSLVYGNINISEKSKPDFNKISKITIGKIINSLNTDRIVFTNNSGLRINRSFSKNTLIIYSKDEIALDNDSIYGKCIIFSDKKIKVSKNAQLENIILCSPKVILANEFKGCIQIIASDSVIIGKHCELYYPSVAFVNPSNNSVKNPIIQIEDSTVFHGLIIGIQNQSSFQNQNILPNITIGNNAEITGQVYSNGNVYHKGIIYGNLVCNEFIDLSSGINESILIDGKISKRKFPDYFPEFSIDEPNYRKILKCLK